VSVARWQQLEDILGWRQVAAAAAAAAAVSVAKLHAAAGVGRQSAVCPAISSQQ